MSWVAVAVGAGVGLTKAELIDQPKADRQRKLAASTQRYSPWTGLQAQPVQEADPMGSMLQYGATGASMGSNMKLQKAQTDWLNAGGSPTAPAAFSGSYGPAQVQPSYAGGMQGASNPWSTNPSMSGNRYGLPTGKF